MSSSSGEPSQQTLCSRLLGLRALAVGVVDLVVLSSTLPSCCILARGFKSRLNARYCGGRVHGGVVDVLTFARSACCLVYCRRQHGCCWTSASFVGSAAACSSPLGAEPGESFSLGVVD